MADIPGPGEPGYSPDRWFQRVVNIGINLARQVGLGLPLFNALRGKFDGVASFIIGQAATMIGQGVRAAQEWMLGGPDYVIDPTDLPISPRGFFGASEADRIIGILDQPGTSTQTGATVYHRTRATWPEDSTKQAQTEIIEEVLMENDDKTPGQSWLEEYAAQQHMLWIGKRF